MFLLVMEFLKPLIFLGRNFTQVALKSNIFEIPEKSIIRTKINSLSLYFGQRLTQILKSQPPKNLSKIMQFNVGTNFFVNFHVFGIFFDGFFKIFGLKLYFLAYKGSFTFTHDSVQYFYTNKK